MDHVGIDVHKRQNQICIETEDGEVIETRVRTDRERFAAVFGGRPRARRVRRVPLSPTLLREVRGRVGRLVAFAEGSPASFANAVRRETGLQGFHVHQMRHTFACQWIERGGGLAALQQLLGHASVVTTQRYSRLSDEAVRREADRIGENSVELLEVQKGRP